MKITSLLTLAIGLVLGLALTSQAHAASATVLEKDSSEFYASGKTRTVKCTISLDSIVITRTFEGMTTTEERSFKVSGPIDAKIDDVSATKAEEKTNKPALDMTYSFVAFKTGSTTPVILSSYDGTTGAEVFNPAPSSGVLREILRTNCGN